MDLLLELKNRMDIDIELVFCPWARALEEIRSGRADLIIGFAYTEERNQFAQYLHPFYTAVEPVLYTQSENGSLIQSYSDLNGKKIGISRESAYFKPFNSDTGLNKIILKLEKHILDMLIQERLDLGVGTNPNMAYDISRYGYRGNLELTDNNPEKATDLYLAISRKSRFVNKASLFEDTLQQILEDGTMERILSQYK
jgi:polar amino acid transport system substrate-binding protein